MPPDHAFQMTRPLTLAALERRQNIALRLSSRTLVRTPKAAERFLADVGMALRYHPGRGLPLASLYRAMAGSDPDKDELAPAIQLTNHLLGTASGIEVNVIAGRLSLVHRALVPALLVLVRRGRGPDDLDGLSMPARSTYALLTEQRAVAAGDVRRRLGVKMDPRHDPAYEALAELQRALLVDRGPFVMPKAGIPYLSTEGYPYHLLHQVHADFVGAAAQLSASAAADCFISGYLDGAVFTTPRTLAKLFRSFLTLSEISASVSRLVTRKVAQTLQVGPHGVVLSARSNA